MAQEWANRLMATGQYSLRGKVDPKGLKGKGESLGICQAGYTIEAFEEV